MYRFRSRRVTVDLKKKKTEADFFGLGLLVVLFGKHPEAHSTHRHHHHPVVHHHRQRVIEVGQRLHSRKHGQSAQDQDQALETRTKHILNS